jgi:hypothetical protein
MSLEQPGITPEAARELRQALDELDEVRRELDDARADLKAMADRLARSDAAPHESGPDRDVANVAFLAKQAKRTARRQRALSVLAPVRDTWLVRPLERAARRMRAARRS